jgi:hypothetical protein
LSLRNPRIERILLGSYSIVSSLGTLIQKKNNSNLIFFSEISDVFKIFIPMKPIAPEKLMKHFKDVQGLKTEWENLKKRFRKTSNEILSEVEVINLLKKVFLMST